MSFTLYPDQLTFYSDTAVSVAKHKRVIACAATGFGKSKVFITIAQNAIAKGRTVLVVTESDKIYRQLDAEINSTTNINAAAKLTYLHPNRIYIAMAQTLSRRAVLVEQFAAMGAGLLIINDEAHIGTATKLLLQFPSAMLIGFTATPHMKWAKHLPLLYNGIVVGSQPEWLVANGRLTPYQHDQVIPAGLDTLQIRGGEFTEESQERVFDTENAHSFVIPYLNKYRYTKCMIFCASIKSAESLAGYLTEAEIRVAVQHSKYDIRSEAMQSYELGQFHDLGSGVDICISVASMNKGYDFPPVDLIMLYRATTSLPLYLQMCGRGSRLSVGKQIWTVVDFGGNGKRHGRWDTNHPWHELWNKVKKKRDGVAPVKDCPKCMYLLPAIAMKCPNCGHEFQPAPPTRIDSVKSVMLEKENAIIAAIKGKRLSELTPVELANWGKIKSKKPHVIRVAKAMEQIEPGYLLIFGQAMGYKQGWYDFQLSEIGEEKIDFYDKIV